ncbi:MAG: ferrous iron transporter B [Chitinivibrionales bacterium]|nr:ferrous iron transporter B [Chitinivibrionales bacterium]
MKKSQQLVTGIGIAIKIGLLLTVSWLIFSAVFFLGTHPSGVIGKFSQYLFLLTWNSVSQPLLRDFLVYGLLTGIAGFVVYLPNIVMMFFIARLLFESNVALRLTAFLHPLLRRLGLSPDSFIALLFGFGCSVNALHAARAINDSKARLLTMVVAPFMSCGSKFGVYLLLVSIVFPPRYAATVFVTLYSFGIFFGLLSTILMRRILKIPALPETGPQQDECFSTVKKPDLLRVVGQTVADGWNFCRSAGSVIVIASLCIWVLSYWPGISQERYQVLQEEARSTSAQLPPRITLSLHNSYLAQFGQMIEPLFRPLGQDWKTAVAILSSLAGRTIIISTLVTLYGIEHTPTSSQTLMQAIAADPSFSRLSAITLMLFVLLCGSCLASITMFYKATGSSLLTALFIAYPAVVAWIVSTLFYQTGRWILQW